MYENKENSVMEELGRERLTQNDTQGVNVFPHPPTPHRSGCSTLCRSMHRIESRLNSANNSVARTGAPGGAAGAAYRSGCCAAAGSLSAAVGLSAAVVSAWRQRLPTLRAAGDGDGKPRTAVGSRPAAAAAAAWPDTSWPAVAERESNRKNVRKQSRDHI